MNHEYGCASSTCAIAPGGCGDRSSGYGSLIAVAGAGVLRRGISFGASCVPARLARVGVLGGMKMHVLTNDQPAGLRLSVDLNLPDEVERYLRDEAWQFVVVGDTDADAFTEHVYEPVVEEWGVPEETVVAAFTSIVEARQAQQAALPADARTSLTAAFADLNERGIVAREHFSCCQRCAQGEIWDERDGTRPWRGYVYFHAQDTEGLIASRSTYLGFGVFRDAWISDAEWESFTEGDQETRYAELAIALMVNEVIPVLERYGMTVAWDRTLESRILLSNADFHTLLPRPDTDNTASTSTPADPPSDMRGSDAARPAQVDRGWRLRWALAVVAVLALTLGVWVVAAAANPELHDAVPRILRSILRIV